MLTNPESIDEIYLERGDVSVHRPVFQGDVFERLVIPGVGIEHEVIAIGMHPCSMRRGSLLVDRLKAFPVTRYKDVGLEKWGESHFRVFPLPQLRAGEDWAIRFDEVGMIESSALSLERRIATLSDRGILLLQQRQVFAETRTAISLATFGQASAAVLAEAELLEEWSERLANVVTDGPAALVREASEFDAFLGGPQISGTLRERLREEHTRSAVRKAVRAEIRRREQAAIGGGGG